MKLKDEIDLLKEKLRLLEEIRKLETRCPVHPCPCVLPYYPQPITIPIWPIITPPSTGDPLPKDPFYVGDPPWGTTPIIICDTKEIAQCQDNTITNTTKLT